MRAASPLLCSPFGLDRSGSERLPFPNTNILQDAGATAAADDGSLTLNGPNWDEPTDCAAAVRGFLRWFTSYLNGSNPGYSERE